MFGERKPKSIAELLQVCERKIDEGDARTAAEIAQKYKNRFVKNVPIADLEGKLDIAYSHYIIEKSIASMLTSGELDPTYDNFKAMFASFYAGILYFQKELLDKASGEWSEQGGHLEYRDRLHGLYDEVREKFDGNEALDEADTDAADAVMS